VASGQIGEFARAIAIGANNTFASPEIKAALQADLNSAGGYSVPAGWLSGWIDRGIEATTVAQYCTRFLTDTAEVNITTLTSRPTAATKAELDKFTESGMTFGNSRLQAFTAGSSFLTSLELLADSPNAGQQIEMACLRGLIDWLNSTMLNGTGSAEPLGVLNREDLPGEDSTGVLDWDKIADGVSALREELYIPNAMIVSPAVFNQLHLQRELTAGDGAYLPRPEHLRDLNIVQSSHCPDTKAILADFTQLMFGIREDATVEVSPVADEAFERNAVRIRLKLRCDWVPAHTAGFFRYDGITLE
jgi:HK97 family phage major capsid protein